MAGNWNKPKRGLRGAEARIERKRIARERIKARIAAMQAQKVSEAYNAEKAEAQSLG